MKLTGDMLASMLCSLRCDFEDNIASLSLDEEPNQKEIDAEIEEINAIRRVLDGRETIELSGDSVWKYFNNILKIG